MRSRLPKRVILLGWVSFFADISSEMIYPLMPLFLVGILGSPTLALGMIEGIAQAIVSVLSAFSGSITDRTGKRVPLVRWGYGLPILGKSIVALAGSWHLVLVGRSIDRFGKGLRGSPRDALIADAIDADRRGEAFGYHRMMDTAGAFVGVMIAGAALWLLQRQNIESAYRVIFGLAAFLAFCSLIVSLFVQETDSSPKQDMIKVETSKAKEFRSSLQGLGSEYWITLLILSIFAFANSSDAFLLLKASDVGLSGLQVVLIYALYNLSYSLFSPTAGKLSDYSGRWKIICIGWAIYALVYAGVAITNDFYIWGLFALYGVYMALTEGVSKALVIDCVPNEKRGTALGLLYMALGFSALSSNVLTGFLWDNFGQTVPFIVGSLMAVVAIAIVLFSGKLNDLKPPLKNAN